MPRERKLTVVDRGDMALNGFLLPPAEGLCQQCAVDHDPSIPHNQQSLFWQYWFYKDSGGRWPTWRDAMAHCDDDMKSAWENELMNLDVDLDQPGI